MKDEIKFDCHDLLSYKLELKVLTEKVNKLEDALKESEKKVSEHTVTISKVTGALTLMAFLLPLLTAMLTALAVKFIK